MPADGISLPFTISGNVGSSRPEKQLSCRDYMTYRPFKRPHFGLGGTSNSRSATAMVAPDHRADLSASGRSPPNAGGFRRPL
jgi:hypothetical protein